MSMKGSYKELLLRAKEMMGQAGLVAYDRAKVLVQVFNDREFRADNGNADDWACARMLNAYCGDLALGFLELKRLVEHFTEREQWAGGNIRRMNATMMAAAEKQAKNSSAPKFLKKKSHDEALSLPGISADQLAEDATQQEATKSDADGEASSSMPEESRLGVETQERDNLSSATDSQKTLGDVMAENLKISAAERVDSAIEAFLNLSKSERREFLARYKFQDAISKLKNAPVVLRADMLNRQRKPIGV